MYEINRNNFNENYSKIENSLKTATFIAIDVEFTGIKRQNASNLLLFDSMPERYKKLRHNIDSFIAIQIGLTTLIYIRDENKYTTETFSFHLLPKEMPFVDREFLMQVSSLEFLTRHNFDFNQLFYNGISFLDEQEEVELRKRLKVNSYTNNFAVFNNCDDEKKFTDGIEKVYKWLKNSHSQGDDLSQSIEIPCDSFIHNCYLQRELRNSFKSIWTESKDKSILIIKVSNETRQALEEEDDKNSDKNLETQIIDYYLGFTKIFKLLTSLKTPIIGHNGLLDIMFMYKQFYKPLPKNYETFKREINRIFPVIYDTKFLSYRLKEYIGKDVLKTNILQGLYEYFTQGAGRLFFKAPTVVGTIDNEKYHDAGWDSYCAAYCFIKVAYAYTVKTHNRPVDIAELTNTQILYGIKDYKNCINVIQADLSYMKLDGPDPESTRPPWIKIRANKLNLINIKEISNALSTLGTVAIHPQSKRSILVAASNYKTILKEIYNYVPIIYLITKLIYSRKGSDCSDDRFLRMDPHCPQIKSHNRDYCRFLDEKSSSAWPNLRARDILEHFQKNKDYRVALYNPLRQSLMTKSLIWGGIVLSGGLLTWLIRDTLLKPAT